MNPPLPPRRQIMCKILINGDSTWILLCLYFLFVIEAIWLGCVECIVWARVTIGENLGHTHTKKPKWDSGERCTWVSEETLFSFQTTGWPLLCLSCTEIYLGEHMYINDIKTTYMKCAISINYKLWKEITLISAQIP